MNLRWLKSNIELTRRIDSRYGSASTYLSIAKMTMKNRKRDDWSLLISNVFMYLSDHVFSYTHLRRWWSEMKTFLSSLDLMPHNNKKKWAKRRQSFCTIRAKRFFRVASSCGNHLRANKCFYLFIQLRTINTDEDRNAMTTYLVPLRENGIYSTSFTSPLKTRSSEVLWRLFDGRLIRHADNEIARKIPAEREQAQSIIPPRAVELCKN